jgi:tetratricopeptide (TPR) repeat protein
MLPGILEQKSDIILIYTGHNEWYGALGAASTDAAGGFFVDLRLLLSNLKVFQVLEDLLQPAQDMPQDTGGGGLMKRMAAKNLVPYKSPLYMKGVEQFENNMRHILTAIDEAGIPVIIGTLVSNLRDLPPFEPVRQEEYTSADTLFEQGSIAYADSNFSAALQLFQSARDYDALRFRAPGEFNTIIKRLAEEYDCVLVNVEEEFNTYSPGGIVGNNVMTDHLHPTLEGYQLLGALYYSALVNSGQLPDAAYSQYSDAEQDSIVKSRFPFSPLDSTVAAMRLAIILNNYPFTDSASTIPVEELITRSNAIDTLAFSVVTGQRSWYNAHLQAAEKYLANDNYSMFALEYRVITAQYWWQPELYRYAAEKLIDKKAYDDALVILEDYHRFQPDAFNAKWIGNIALFRNDYEKAAVYLFESAQHNNKDAQVYYNLSGAYIGLKEFTKAISALDNCLRIDSQYPGAAQLKEQLLRQPAQ